MPHIVVEGDHVAGVTFLSQAFETYAGQPIESGLGFGLVRFIHPKDIPAVRCAWNESLASLGELVTEFRLRRADRTYRWHVARVIARTETAKGIAQWTGTITDIHEMRRSAQERAFLSEASGILAQSLDLETTLGSLANITIPLFADWCQIDLATPSGGILTAAIAHRDPAKRALAQELVGRVHLNPGAERAIPYTIRTGRTDVIPDVRSIAPEAVDDDGEMAIYAQLGLGSAICVPLVADGKTLGAIAFNYESSDREYTLDDVPVLEELGRRAGVAVRRASDFEREHRVAQSFQEASLPAALPVVHGAAFDAVYVPGNAEAQVGGDWYDAVRLGDGRIVVSIGDVAGNGLRAAVTMGNMRQIIRGIAQVHADPSLMLDAADRALRLEHPDRFVTAFVGVYDPVSADFAYASAGHPPPILRHPDGRIELLSDGGLPLGLRHLAGNAGKSVVLEPGSHLALYTDGLIEASRRPADGEERLRALLADATIFRDERPAQALLRAVFAREAPADDVAILVLSILEESRAKTPTPIQRWRFEAGDARAAQAARHDFTTALAARAADDESIRASEVIFGELIGNVARYANGPVEVAIDWSAPAPVLHVLDEGPGFHHVPALPRDVYSESGRGLYIISSLSDSFTVARRATRGSHARAVLALKRRRNRRSHHVARSPEEVSR